MTSSSAVAAADRWAGGVCPFAAGWQRVMMWWFVVSDGLLFGGFLAAYGYARLLATAWPAPGTVFSLPYLAAMTFVLITSSTTMATAVHWAKHGDWRRTQRLLAITMLGGLVFLGMQAYEWWHVINEGASLTANPWGDVAFGAYFFVITGFHGTHVLTGMLIMTILSVRVATGKATTVGMEMAGLYWHFVELVWAFIFTLFYLL